MRRWNNSYSQNGFTRGFNLMNRVFWAFFIFVFLLILIYWSFVGWSIYTVVTNPEAVGRGIGEIVGPIMNAVE